MIFLDFKSEGLVQVNDKTRLDVSGSFVSDDSPITEIEITLDDGSTYMSVFNDGDIEKWYLDWSFSLAGEKTIGVRATDGTNTVSQSYTLEVVSEEDDNLYSTDSQLFSIESDLKRYIPSGRNSFKNIHREAQSRILNYLDIKRIWNDDGEPYTKEQINIYGELQKWSLYEAILIIYGDLYISGGDKFAEKLNEYKALRGYERDRGAIRIDKNSSGTIDSGSEFQDLKSFRMIIR